MTEDVQDESIEKFDILMDMTPARLRSMSNEVAETLAGVIRSFLVENVTKTGGHLGANLGAIELTIALHRSFDSPATPFVFDIGHQCYTHKIITGRARGFRELRQRSGLSGFPSRAESAHDFVENSHSSVGPGWALGMTLGGAKRVVLILGDGALTGGVAYEGLNAIGVARAPVTVIYNDNGRSYDVTHSRLSAGERGSYAGGARNVKSFFEALGFRYYGPVDGHSIGDMSEVFSRAPEGEPSIVHVRTVKGRGWSVAEQDDIKRMHDVSAPGAQNGGRSWGDLVGRELVRRAADDPRLHVVTAAMPDTLGLTPFKLKFPKRYHDVGMAEQVAVNVCAGLAMRGMKPVLPIVSTFMTRAIDQLLYDVGLHGLGVLLLVDRAGVTGPDGPSHHGLFDVGYLARIPGTRIYAPRTEGDFTSTLDTHLSKLEGGLTVVRYSKGSPVSGCDYGGDKPQDATTMIIGYGATGDIVMEARRVLTEEQGCSGITGMCLSRVHPIPSAALERMARCDRVWVVEDTLASCGVADELRRRLDTLGSGCLVSQIAFPDEFVPAGSRGGLLAEYGLEARRVAATVLGGNA
ncbi:1-deoxy-D-xylulose-5-phosphate synthase N-terminal domain-containing protein [Actinomyces sp.]|uniref:1-deoxy-D-xylulose-5-phosphate synthase N-terminal domain-containing protein n=1 Tax=Actinomyces sp. TaxID=29317 RepID=UPI0026DBD72F|nr:1-deoxy-D-xylulose-5-phosphate synthase N-terminal domain-containing protein [Actinomyces sp.]MDO4899865.1 1-deoxy-D-xylulose-5-phosphate synthase N-terminal domain-containing protein [Actinomyces sp.]